MTSYSYPLANHRYLRNYFPGGSQIGKSNQDLIGIATAEPSRLHPGVFWATLGD